MGQVGKGIPSSVFEKADQPKWDSKFAIEDIVIAPGATMHVSVENHTGGAFGDHSKWTWGIYLVAPKDATIYRGISFAYAVGDEVDSWLFELVGTAEVKGITLAYYRFKERWNPSRLVDVTRPIDKILRRMLKAKTVRYRVSTGLKGVGPQSEGALENEVADAMRALLKSAKNRNWTDEPEYQYDWMND